MVKENEHGLSGSPNETLSHSCLATWRPET